MSEKKQRESDIEFLRKIVANTQVGSAKVAMALAIDRLKAEPLVSDKKQNKKKSKQEAKITETANKASETETKPKEKSDFDSEPDEEDFV